MLSVANKCFLYYQGSIEEALRLWGFLDSGITEILYLNGRVGGMLVMLFLIPESFSGLEFYETVIYGYRFQIKLYFCHGFLLATFFSISFGVK